MKLNIMIDNYVRLVGIVDSLYYVYENLIIKTDRYKNLNKINLNKKRVDDIFSDYIVDKKFNDYIQFYINSFNNVFFTNDFKVDSILVQIEEGIYFVKQARYRIKSPESIMNKLAKYTDRKENGKIKINKCLNDLFGIRFIIDDYNKLRREFIDYLDIRVNQEIGFRNKIKLTSKGYNNIDSPYIADHVYFSSRLNNNIFPIELQIWDSVNLERNEKSHVIYKREYTNWAYQYNDI